MLQSQVPKQNQLKMAKVRVNSDKVQYTKDLIEARYDYQTTQVEVDQQGCYVATPQTTQYTFQTQRKVMWIYLTHLLTYLLMAITLDGAEAIYDPSPSHYLLGCSGHSRLVGPLLFQLCFSDLTHLELSYSYSSSSFLAISLGFTVLVEIFAYVTIF